MSSQDEKDDQLALRLEAAKSGDSAALEELIEEFYEFVRQQIKNAVPSEIRQKTGASEIAQEAFLQFTTAVQGITAKSRGEFAQWLKKAATNKSLDAIRRYRAEKRDVGREQELDANLPVGQFSSQDTPSMTVAREEEGQHVRNSISDLPTTQREILQLFFYDELDLTEIGRRLDLSPYMVTKHLRDAMQAVQKQLPKSLRRDPDDA